MADIKTFKYFVNNSWHEPSSGKFFDTENPATGVTWAQVPDCRSEEINLAVAAAKHAFYEGPWGKMMPAERGRYLRKIGDVISRNANRLGSTETLDNGKYQVTLEIESAKVKADSIGNETKKPINDWIDIGFFMDSEEKQLYAQQRLKFNQEKSTITVELDSLPVKAAIDPRHILIDRVYKDNIKSLSLEE